jgi:hypothetical protein
MQSDAEAILQSKKSNKKAYVASSAAKESDASSCNCVSLKCYRACADTYAMPSQGTGSRVQLVTAREDIAPHGVLKDTVVRNRGAHLLLAMQHALLSYRRRIKTCGRSCER